MGGLQPVLERTGFVAGRDIVVMDADGNLVGNTSGSPAGELKGLYAGGPAPVVVDKKRVGSVYVEKDIAALKRGMIDKKPPPLWTKFAKLTDEQLRQYAGSFEEPAVTHITDATNRSLILAGAGAGPDRAPAGIPHLSTDARIGPQPDRGFPEDGRRRPVPKSPRG